MKTPEFRLEVARPALSDALKRLAKTVAKRAGEEAVLSFDGANLHIDIGGGCMTVPAKGTFDCQVRVSGKTLLNLTQVLPSGNPILIVATKDQLRIQNCALRCTMQDAWSKIIDLPVNLTDKEAAEYLAHQSTADLEASGLTKVAGGRAETIREAARLLAPYKICESDIENLIHDKRRKTDADLFGEP